MRNTPKGETMPRKALIYCRVSSKKQRTEGSGLDSQEHRCRQYADENGWDVMAVFPDDVTGGGDFMNRPGMRALLAYLDAQIDERFVVIFDDLKRFTRDRVFHWMLRAELAERGAILKCLNFNFEDTPEGEFVESIVVSAAHLERQQMARQNGQKSRARVEAGYAVHKAPYGYKYVSEKGRGGKILVPSEPLASTVREALEGFANGRFQSQAEVQRFCMKCPHFPKTKDGFIRPMIITHMLKKVMYAGYIESKKWGISLRKAQHEPLIAFETFERIQDRLAGRKPVGPARKDLNEDFPLRGFVACDSCGNMMTGAWSKGCRQHYAYYRCMTRGCSEKSKSIPKAKIEAGLEAILKQLQLGSRYVELLRQMISDAWAMRLLEADEAKAKLDKQLNSVETKIEGLLDRIVDSDDRAVISRYEDRLSKLEREKIRLSERAATIVPPTGRKEQCIELGLRFLSSPYDIYKNGSFLLRQTVLRLAFSRPIKYCRNEGYGSIESSLPFNILGRVSGHNYDQSSEMVL